MLLQSKAQLILTASASLSLLASVANAAGAYEKCIVKAGSNPCDTGMYCESRYLHRKGEKDSGVCIWLFGLADKDETHPCAQLTPGDPNNGGAGALRPGFWPNDKHKDIVDCGTNRWCNKDLSPEERSKLRAAQSVADQEGDFAKLKELYCKTIDSSKQSDLLLYAAYRGELGASPKQQDAEVV